jgi:hypothetical protein
MKIVFLVFGCLTLVFSGIWLITIKPEHDDAMTKATLGGAFALVGIGWMIAAAACRTDPPKQLTAMPAWQPQPAMSPGSPATTYQQQSESSYPQPPAQYGQGGR